MQIIAQQDNQPIWLIKMQQDEQFYSPCQGKEFAALIAIYDQAVSDENRNTLCDALIAQGCRNGVFWGCDCSGWDDALDWAFLATDPNHNPPESHFVMSSWYGDQPLEDAVFGSLKCSAFGNYVPHNFVVITIGDGPYEEIIKAINSETADTNTG